MRKIMHIAVFFVGFSSFANSIKEEITEFECENSSEALLCCTATLTYYGVPYDSETICGPSQAGNCKLAKDILLKRNPFTGLN